jgi:hypothetical protein
MQAAIGFGGDFSTYSLGGLPRGLALNAGELVPREGNAGSG